MCSREKFFHQKRHARPEQSREATQEGPQMANVHWAAPRRSSSGRVSSAPLCASLCERVAPVGYCASAKAQPPELRSGENLIICSISRAQSSSKRSSSQWAGWRPVCECARECVWPLGAGRWPLACAWGAKSFVQFFLLLIGLFFLFSFSALFLLSIWISCSLRCFGQCVAVWASCQ